MPSKYTKTLLLLFCSFILLQRHLLAQNQPDSQAYKTERAVVIYAGGGISFFTGMVGTPTGFEASVQKQHGIGSLRLMYHPGHLLHVGLETGWVRFYSYTINNNGKQGATETNATPILFILSMPATERLHLFTGTGIYLMESKLDYDGHVDSKAYSLGYMLAASYCYPLSKNFGIAGEAKWMDATGTRDAVLSLELQLKWKLKLKPR